MLKLFTLISCLVFSITAYSYPNFIGKGYHNCLTCHYNPFGNGPLNDYGRGVAASGLAGRLFINKKTTDEDLSNRSSFLFGKPDKSWIVKPALDYRGATLQRPLQTDETEETWINMQLDASLSAEFGKNKDIIATYTYSVVPANSLPAGSAAYGVAAGEDLVFSREHYIGYKVNPSLRVYLGKMDKVFGIRVPDHTAYSRRFSGNTQYDATHGAMVHWGKEKFDLGAQYFIGDQEKESDYQSSGFSGKYEHSVSDNVRLGVSLLNESYDTRDTTAYSFLTKMGVGKGSSVMFELGRVTNTPSSGDPTTLQYIFLQNHYYLTRGLYFLTTYEQYVPNTEETAENHAIAPGIQYFPMQRVEIRADLINRKSYSTTSATKDEWEFLGQVHLWF